jgi:HAD superfamily hydrolase (TIGR01509 family)
MAKKTLIFDMDGVLIDCKHLHAKAFINAWNEVNTDKIDELYHEKYLDGLNTKAKIKYLEDYFNIKTDMTKIFDLKQEYTYKNLEDFEYSTTLYSLFSNLKNEFHLACASNSIRNTVELCLKKLNIYEFFESILSNEDVINPKPHPEIYNRTMTFLNSNKEDTYIFEDSQYGLQAAYASGANVIQIYDSKDLNYNFIIQSLRHKMRYTPWLDNPLWKLRVVIPMAGEGSRFKEAGYTITKPLIPIQGKPMIQWVLENLQSKDKEVQKRIEYHLIVREQAVDELKVVQTLFPNVFLHSIPKLTEGAACTVLTVRDILLSDNNPLLMANSDQFLEYDFDEFLQVCVNPDFDGTISTFYNPDINDTKWSFAALDANGYVRKVAEKEYIGPNATTGIYYWQDGSNFVYYSEKMIQANDRVKNEFYVGPVYNYVINDCGKVRIYDCKKMWGLGVPDDLNKFLKDYLDE